MTDLSQSRAPVAPHLVRRLARMLRTRLLRPAVLDPDELPEHLRRDIGFIDGRTLPPRNWNWD